MSTMTWVATPEAEQRRIRIRLALAAFAYEYRNTSIMSDADYDKLALEVDTSIATGNKQMDKFFKTKYNPDTGMWVRTHPKKQALSNLYQQLYG